MGSIPAPPASADPLLARVQALEAAQRDWHAERHRLTLRIQDLEQQLRARQGAAVVWTAHAGLCVLGGSLDPPNLRTAERVGTVLCADGSWPTLPAPRYTAGSAVIGIDVYLIAGFGSTVDDLVLRLPLP